ncbi:aspartyl protease [Clostridium aceticum]|uniref:Aspartyl protease n=1 Tax=Clostridium aceticum TaxID=84022 RepID=A0A0D8I6E5_9CLOT|nr:retropepsin-like aspartic protease [Clostridium aceticum]AKL96987.1 aspartyl protease [Clostridium aceticum]KJF25634.1 aspartyl protease [Clostridium aceticum]
MKIIYRDGLLYTSVKISYKGQIKIIDNIVVDTGAAVSIISPDAVYDLEIYPEEDDEIVTFIGVGGSEHHSFTKKIDEIEIGKFTVVEAKVDFGIIDPAGEINGLLGLDILIAMGATIDLKEFKIC